MQLLHWALNLEWVCFNKLFVKVNRRNFLHSWVERGRFLMLESVARVVSTAWRWSINCGAVSGPHSSVGCGTFLVPMCQDGAGRLLALERACQGGLASLVVLVWIYILFVPLKSNMLSLYWVSGWPLDRIRPKGSAYTSLCHIKNDK